MRRPNIGCLLRQRSRRWPNKQPMLGKHGSYVSEVECLFKNPDSVSLANDHTALVTFRMGISK